MNQIADPGHGKESFFGRFAIHNTMVITFITIALCFGGIYAITRMPSSVFPQTDFPRVVILVDNGVMPEDEMMATVTRPIEEAMKDIPGAVNVRSATGRGAAEINVFFNWKVDMIQSEQYVLGRMGQIRTTLPQTAEATVWRVTFSAFPIIGVSLTGEGYDITQLWETARYDVKPQILSIPGVARVDIVGGRTPEYHVIVDPMKLTASGLDLAAVTDRLERSNLVAPTGMHEENYQLYLTVVDGRVHDIENILNIAVGMTAGRPVLIRDFARVERGPEPVYNVVTAEGREAVLLNVRSQPDGSTLDIARELNARLDRLRTELPADMKVAFFYDQSLIVRESVLSVWEAIIFGLILSVGVLYLFLRNWGSTIVAALVIPVTILITLLAIRLMNLSFNLMTLGGIAAAIGVVIDDAIVVVESIHTRLRASMSRQEAVKSAISDIARPLVASTLTPVVVFIPLAFLDGITGVFFRALAMTMAVALLTSLALAVTFTPSLAVWFMKPHKHSEGPFLAFLSGIYERSVRFTLRHSWLTVAVCIALILGGYTLYGHLQSEFLPPMDEGGFVIDYVAPFGTSLSETDRQLMIAEQILLSVPEVESYSRRTGARLALAIAEPNTGDFLVKLTPDRTRSTEDVISELRRRLNASVPDLEWEFPGILGDLIGDLMWAPSPIEVKIFSTDIDFLKENAPLIEEELQKVDGVVDTFDGLVYTGSTINLSLRTQDAARYSLTTEDVANAVNTAMLGKTASSVLEGDRVVDIRVLVDPVTIDKLTAIRNLPLMTPTGALIKLSQVADVVMEDGQLELRREDMRQNIAVTARLEGRDMGSAMTEIRDLLGRESNLPPGTIEYGGLYQQQQESFRNLVVVLAMAVILVFTVLLAEFGTFTMPLAIVFGSVLSLFGTIVALLVTGTSFNVVSFLGAIIGIGIVAKNGILMLDLVDHYRIEGLSLDEALVRSGTRRLRPVLMTSLTTLLGMLPLAYGIGSGADMLKPLAIAIMGALCISVLLALIATPTFYRVLVYRKNQ